MTYDIKNVFYLDTNFDIPAAQAAVSERGRTLDISAYIDPVAKGRAKGVGLAIYKVHFDWSENKGNAPVGPTEAGYTNTPSDVDQAELAFCAANQNLVAGQDFFGPVYAGTAGMYENEILSPSIEVPYIAVRDTLNLVWGNGITAGTLVNNLSVRIECAQISLGTDVLNQLLRTQTV
jgi:hypothetical protein